MPAVCGRALELDVGMSSHEREKSPRRAFVNAAKRSASLRSAVSCGPARRRLHVVRLRTHADDLDAVIAQRRPEAARYIAVGVAEAEMQARARIAGADVLQR